MTSLTSWRAACDISARSFGLPTIYERPIICIMIYVYDLILSTPMSETGLLDVDIEGDDKMVRPNTIDHDESTKKCESANRKQCSKYKLDSYAYYRFVKMDKFQHRWH